MVPLLGARRYLCTCIYMIICHCQNIHCFKGGSYFANDIFKCICIFSWMKSFVFFIEISLNIVPRRPIDNKAALVQVTVLSNRTRFLVEVFKRIWGWIPSSWAQYLSWTIDITTPAMDQTPLKTVLKPSNMVFKLAIKELNVGIFNPPILKKSKI